MTFHEILLVVAWLLPLVVGLWQIARPAGMLRYAPYTAVPALVAALAVPLDTSFELSWLLLGATLQLDAMGQAFLLFTAILWLVSGVVGMAYLQKDENRPRFFGYYMLAMSGNFGLIVAGDMLSYYLWFAVMSFASYGLVVHTGAEFARRAGSVYIQLVVIGEVLLFAALVMIASDNGSFLLPATSDVTISTLAAVLVFISFGLKAGVIVLHVWLPLAHPAAPVPASAVLSGAMIKAGLLGWMRFLQPAEFALEWGEFLIVVGLLSAFYGALVGVWQHDPKAVLAYSSISQMGLITVGAGASLLLPPETQPLAISAVMLYAVHHGLAKGALFLGVGLMGTSRAMVGLLFVPALALAGLPLTSGAVAKAELKFAAESLPPVWRDSLELLLPFAAVGTTLLMARFLHLMWTRATGEKVPHPVIRAGVAATIVVGLAIMPVWSQASDALQKSFEADKLFVAVWPILLGTVIALGYGVLSRGVPALKEFTIAAGDVLYPLEALIYALLGALVAVKKGVEAVADAVFVWAQRSLQPSEGQKETAVALELRLRNWTTAGSWLLGLALVFLLAVWLGG